jgi:hypothetical protein
MPFNRQKRSLPPRKLLVRSSWLMGIRLGGSVSVQIGARIGGAMCTADLAISQVCSSGRYVDGSYVHPLGHPHAQAAKTLGLSALAWR